MTGKIFEDSANIYDDQAKVLFDYYKQAASKIVSEEMALEKKIKDAQEHLQVATKQKKQGFITLCIAGGIAFIFAIIFLLCALHVLYLGVVSLISLLLWLGGIVGLILGMLKFFRNKKVMKEEGEHIQAFGQAKDDIRRDYKVQKLGVVYVPIATKIPFENKSFTVDYTGQMGATSFSLSMPHKESELHSALTELETHIKEVPIVETNDNAESVDTSEYSLSMQSATMHDYLGGIDRQVRNISYLLNDNDNITVDLPIVEPASPRDDFLNEYGTDSPQDHPVLNIFDTSSLNDKFLSFSKLNDMKKAMEKEGKGGDVEYFKTLMKKLGETVQFLSESKTYSTSKLLEYSNMIFSCVLKAGFNQYSPTLEAEEIARIREATFDFNDDNTEDYKPFTLKQSSKVRYDLFSNAWVAEDNSRTNMPFGMNQIQEEILMPLIYNLMNETRIERLKIYNNINDQKMRYKNEWNKDVEAAFRDNRKTGQELLTQITGAFAEYNAAYQTYNSYKSTQDTLKKSGDINDSEVQEKDTQAEQIAGFEIEAKQSSEVSQEFQQYMERLQEDIDLKTKQFEHIEYYEASLRDSQSRDMAKSLDLQTLKNLDERRKRLLQASPYYAAFAKLPPEPRIEEKLTQDFTVNIAQKADALLDNIKQMEEQNNTPTPEKAEESQSPNASDNTSPKDLSESSENSDNASASDTVESSSASDNTSARDSVESNDSIESSENSDSDAPASDNDTSSNKGE